MKYNLENKKLVVVDTNGTTYSEAMANFPGVEVVSEQEAFSNIVKTLKAVRNAGVDFIRMDNHLVHMDHIVSISIVEYQN